MFGENRRSSFINSLITTGAEEFRGITGENQSPLENAAQIGRNAMSLADDHAPVNIPEMILAEDSGSTGEQITASADDFRSFTQTRQPAQPVMPRQQSAQSLFRDSNRKKLPAGIPSARESNQTPAREIMQRKLNPFQIEKLAEKIKEQLESEMKVEKERRGEEP